MHYKEVKGLLSAKNGMNTYRGCTHGCIYCDSRSKCYNINHEFTDIEIKINAPLLLENSLKSKRKKCMIGTGSMSDPYLPLEENELLTRKCLEIINYYGFGISIITKSNRILRDLSILKEINKKAKCVIQMTLTTYNDELCKIIEPNVSSTKERFEALRVLHENNIPTIVWLCPILPFINDTEENLKGILKYCIDAKVKGIICFGFGLTLREGNREYFYEQLDKYFPTLKEKYIRTYGNKYELNSPNNAKLKKIFYETCKKYGIEYNQDKIFQYLKEFPEKDRQLSIYDN